MSLSKRELKTGGLAISFDPIAVGAALHDECPEVDFAILMGSGRDGKIPPGGDLDLAVGLRQGWILISLTPSTASPKITSRSLGVGGSSAAD